MANAIFKRGTSAEIDDIAISDGQVLWTTDLGVSNKIYNDVGTNRVPIGGNIIEGGKYEEFTYVVDSNTALNNWANNVSGNDYTSVLIRKGTWNLTNSGNGIQLTQCGTKKIVGEYGNLVKINGYTKGFNYDIKPDLLDITNTIYSIQGVNVFGDANAFTNCVNLINCSAKTTYDSSEFYYTYKNCSYLTNCKGINGVTKDCSYLTNCVSDYKYYNCNNMNNCYVKLAHVTNSDGKKKCAYEGCSYLTNCVDETSKTSYEYTDINSFYNCDNLINCITTRTSGVKLGSHGFDSCRHLVNCKSSYEYSGFVNCYSVSNCDSLGDVSAYPDSYASSSKISTYACADTPNGGFNSKTTS